MLFGTPLFLLVFLPMALAAFHMSGRWLGRASALGLLIVASLVFYGWGRPAELPLLMGSIAVNYALGRRVADSRWFAGGIAVNLGVLGLFKYGTFIAAAAGVPDPHLSLPLGISFFTFQQRGYCLLFQAPNRGNRFTESGNVRNGAHSFSERGRCGSRRKEAGTFSPQDLQTGRDGIEG